MRHAATTGCSGDRLTAKPAHGAPRRDLRGLCVPRGGSFGTRAATRSPHESPPGATSGHAGRGRLRAAIGQPPRRICSNGRLPPRAPAFLLACALAGDDEVRPRNLGSPEGGSAARTCRPPS